MIRYLVARCLPDGMPLFVAADGGWTRSQDLAKRHTYRADADACLAGIDPDERGQLTVIGEQTASDGTVSHRDLGA